MSSKNSKAATSPKHRFLILTESRLADAVDVDNNELPDLFDGKALQHVAAVTSPENFEMRASRIRNVIAAARTEAEENR